MNHEPTCPQYLRAQITIPKLSGVDFFKTREHRLAYEHLLGTIWRELLKLLQDPIKVSVSKTSRRVEVLGILRYFVNHRTLQVTCSINQGKFLEDGWHFSYKKISCVMIDPPAVCNQNLIGHFVNLWIGDIDRLADIYFAESKSHLNIELIDCVEAIQAQITQSIYNAIRTSSNWKQLRNEAFKALALDPELVRYSRLSRLTLKVRNLSELHFNHVCKHREAYRQIYCDTPKLLWLYSLATEENILDKISTNPVADLKQAIIASGCTQRAWRILAKANHRDFDTVIVCNNRKWHFLTEYLKLHERLDRSLNVSRKLAHIFDNPFWHLPEDNNFIAYRGAKIKPQVFNKLINETARRQSLGEVSRFEQTELASVLTWIAQTRVAFDANQLRQPWAWFARKASEWFAEQLAFDQLKSLSWQCGLSESDNSGFLFTPITNAWQLRLEAVKQRHCADNYIDRCIGGTYRVFRIKDLSSKATVTLGLCLYNDKWEIDQVKGYSNRPVSNKLYWLCQVIADGLDIIEEGALKDIKNNERLQAERFRNLRPEDIRFRRWSIP
jgi:hypothetical protein